MSDDGDEGTDGTGDMATGFPLDHAELLDALRLAEALERVEAGHASDVDPIEDPALAGLVSTASRLRADLGDVARGHAFHSFRLRSRDAVLHALEPAPAAKVIPFYHSEHAPFGRWRRARFVAPFAAAAVAAAIALVALGGSPAGYPGILGKVLPGHGGDSRAVATNLTPRSTAEELDRLAAALLNIQTRAQNGQSVSAPLLRAVAEGTARVANTIEQNPGQLSKEAVTTYIQAAQSGQSMLSSLTVDQDAQGALAAAQRAARDGVVVAARFLAATPTPLATPAATESPAPTATPVASATPTISATPAPSATPAGSNIVR